MGRENNAFSFPGTGDEARDLLKALKRNCTCKTEHGRTVAACDGHTMLARDRRAVNGLVFERRNAARLRAEEFDTKKR